MDAAHFEWDREGSGDGGGTLGILDLCLPCAVVSGFVGGEVWYAYLY